MNSINIKACKRFTARARQNFAAAALFAVCFLFNAVPNIPAQYTSDSRLIAVSDANAQNIPITNATAQLERTVPLGLSNRINFAPSVVDPNSVYSNVTTFTGSAAKNGGAALQGTNTITALMADDLTTTRTLPYNIVSYRFNVANFNGTAVSARPLIRFYANDGAGGGPGTLLGGNNFNVISFGAGSVTTFSTGTLATPFAVTTATIWAG